jgi:hypothetical protein
MVWVTQDVDQKKQLHLPRSMYFRPRNIPGILKIIQIRPRLPLGLAKSLSDGPAFCLANSLHRTRAPPIKTSLLHPGGMEPQTAVSPDGAGRLLQHCISTVPHLDDGRYSIWSERWGNLPPA